jgi:hypothetical protein
MVKFIHGTSPIEASSPQVSFQYSPFYHQNIFDIQDSPVLYFNYYKAKSYQGNAHPSSVALASTRENLWTRQGAGAACHEDKTMKTSSGQEKAQMRFTFRVKMGIRALLSRKLCLVALILLVIATWSLSLFVLPSASAAAPKTRAVTTGALQMTGQGAGAAEVRLTSGTLQMTGQGAGAAEVKLISGALQMTGQGAGAAAVRLTSGALQMTGQGAGATEVRLTSGALQMTGQGAGATAVRITTSELRMTGFGL